MEREKASLTKRLGKIALCCIPAVIVLGFLSAVFISYELFPFGNNTLSWCDMDQQVIPLLMDFKDILEGKSSFFLNLQNAGGMNFWGVFLFFLSSPFSFLVLFVEKADFFRLVNVLVALKMAVCSVTAFTFFRRRFPTLDLVAGTVLSVLYACSGYALFYYQNLVWLDVMYLFPLFLLALLRLAEQEKPLAYILALSAMLIVHFYLSYMLVIFLVLASGIWLFTMPGEKRGRALVLLGLSTAAAALLTAPVWLPSLIQYAGSARTGNLIESLQIGSFITRLNTTLPVLLSTSALGVSLVLTLLYWKKASARIRAVYILFVLLLIPVIIEPINKMWHTGSYQAFPVRYGYMVTFLGLVLLAFLLTKGIPEEENRLQDTPVPLFLALVSTALPFVASCILLYLKFDEITVYTRTLWGNDTSLSQLAGFFLTAALAGGVLILFLRERLLSRRIFTVLLCILLCIEVPFQLSVYLGSAASSADGYAEEIDLADKIPDDTLYRVKNQKKYFDANLLGGLGYPTLNHYTSLTSKSYMFAMKKLGYSSYWMEVNSNGGTALTDAILGNRYTVYKHDDLSEDSKVVYWNDSYAIAQELYSLPFGFVFHPQEVEQLSSLSEELSRMELQQWLFESLFDTKEQLVAEYQPQYEVNLSVEHGEKWELTPHLENGRAYFYYEIDVQGTQTLYFDCFDELHNYLYEAINDSFHVFVDGELIEQDYPSQSSNGLIELGTFTDETVVVQVELLRDCSARSFGVYGMDLDVLGTSLSSVSEDSLREENGELTGTFLAKNGDYLFVPVPNDGGVTVTVNGEQVEAETVFDCFLAVPLTAGENTVTVTSFPPGMSTGIVLCFCGAAAVVLLVFIFRKGYPAAFRFLELPAKITFVILFAGVFLVVYVFPVVVYCLR